MFKKILVPVDGSEGSWRALNSAVEIGEKFGSELEVVNVIQASTSAKPIRKISGRCLVSPLSSEQVTGLTYCAIRQAAADSSALKRSMILTVPELNIHKSTPN